MDSRGFSVDPSDATPFILPASRLQAWVALAERSHTVVELVPAQREHLAA
ncbi:hypothetical protein [Cellulomonas fimi]|uniref:Uncharacterized protein n=1 Tax=Cellulomonas fimi (strain ATCC 484 / DSM 20113 / JCM 1341 / CCUG 24087 / LMG 16345 / NBRC 15513 / NCIMB 8980 / NCTC 7547 / NRS-133) TaxID=590998 RepID=F4H5P1_CELFA|nr:hypothetical protein [Cellulomonas fimi]AEE44365.1 hypothetical protein Celf_0219 [Cellulomonas fimi ATCC 484]NNH08655.1 hypothetical protein [Cellulomonas fimi]VEH26212.1 Uncharacterised protein [Cellulomonas fimi]